MSASKLSERSPVDGSCVLGITTVGSPGGIALCVDGVVCGVDLERDSIRYSRTLLKQIQAMLGANDKKLADLTAVAVCTGPGSFTGIRVGLAVARSLAFSLQIPLVGVTAHAALRSSHRDCNERLAVVMDARRDEIYTVDYAPGATSPSGPIMTRSIEETVQWLASLGQGGPVRVVGDAVPRYLVDQEGLGQISLDGALEHAVGPETVALEALAALGSQDAHDWKTVGPVYVRRSDEELGLKIKKTPSL